MDSFTILNYQGSKKSLVDFIHTNTAGYVNSGETILDIFAGTCAVGYSYKATHRVFANDSEYYSYIISRALLGGAPGGNADELLEALKGRMADNLAALREGSGALLEREKNAVEAGNAEELAGVYGDVPTIWCAAGTGKTYTCYHLFTTYYSTSYFGLAQAMEIDSLRYAIDEVAREDLTCVLLACLFYAMKECVFSKDGHMAQPLDMAKNPKKLLVQRGKALFGFFEKKLREFYSPVFVLPAQENAVFNEDFEALLANERVRREVGFIYADPPYTDMQYSRYYHLLNIVARYDYPAPTAGTTAGYTKGLYTEGRFQSQLSKKRTCLPSFTRLMEFAKEYEKNLAVSFAYPRNEKKQKTDRYVMSIDEIRSTAENIFGPDAVKVVHMDYTHSNNRNSAAKKVLEYLVLCRGN